MISATAAWPDRLHNGPSRPLLPAIGDLVETGDVLAMDLVVSFVMVSGLRLLQPHLDAVLDRDGRVRLLTTDYLGITEGRAANPAGALRGVRRPISGQGAFFRSGFLPSEGLSARCAPGLIRRGIRWQREHQRLGAAGRIRVDSGDPRSRCAASDSGFLP